MGVAFSERHVVAAAAGDEGPRIATRELAPGLLTPSPSSPNIQSVRDVARLATEALGELGPTPPRLSVVLPDGCVTTRLFSSSRSEAERDLLASFRSKLPFPADEARSDAWRGTGGELVAAAVREAVVRQYEQVVEAADARLGWVDAASLASLPDWIGEADGAGNELAMRVLLYPSHYSVAVLVGRELVGLRTKLRAPGDAAAVALELMRVPALYEADSVGRVVLAGVEAAECARQLEPWKEPRRVEIGESSEVAILLSAIVALFGRA